MLNKKGDATGEMPGWVIGVLIGISVALILFSVSGRFWGLLTPQEIDSDSFNSFQQVSRSISKLYEGGGENSNVPIELGKEFGIVGFGKGDSRTTCSGLPIVKPSSCDGACLCICDSTAGESMCLVSKARCLSYGDVIDFGEGCNAVAGTGERGSVKVANNEGIISINGGSFAVSSVMA